LSSRVRRRRLLVRTDKRVARYRVIMSLTAFQENRTTLDGMIGCPSGADSTAVVGTAQVRVPQMITVGTKRLLNMGVVVGYIAKREPLNFREYFKSTELMDSRQEGLSSFNYSLWIV